MLLGTAEPARARSIREDRSAVTSNHHQATGGSDPLDEAEGKSEGCSLCVDRSSARVHRVRGPSDHLPSVLTAPPYHGAGPPA
eukprot:882267-Alexandrium_andersonii.AAC.1